MKNTKFLYLISIFNMTLLVIMLFGFSGAGDKGSISIGYNAKIVERDSNLVIMYGDDTPRVIIVRNTNDMVLGTSTVNPKGSITAEYFNGTNGISTFNQVGVNTSVGYITDFAVEGTSTFTGYLTGDSIYGRTVRTPTLSATTGSITTLTGTSATYDNLRASDSLVSDIVKSKIHLMRSKSGPALDEEEAVMYLKGALLIFAYKDSGGSIYYYYCDLSVGGDITQLTYSLGEP